MRQALGRPVLLRCSLLRGSPQRITSAVWRFKGQLLPPPPAVPVAAEASDHSELRLDAVTRDSSGSYECSVSNDVGSAACLFQVSGERPVGPTLTQPSPLGPRLRPNSSPACSWPTYTKFRPQPFQELPMLGLDAPIPPGSNRELLRPGSSTHPIQDLGLPLSGPANTHRKPRLF